MTTRPLLRSLACAALLASAASAGARSPEAGNGRGEAPHYAAAFDAQTQSADVQLCLPQAHASVTFAADSGWAMRFISAVKRAGGAAADAANVTAGDGAWRANDWHAGECLSYRADLHAIAQERKPDVGWQMGGDFIAAPQLWLLRADVQGDADAEISVDLPTGWAISAPWRELGREGKNIRFHIPNTPSDWSAAVAFGHFGEERIALP
ncbi:MAG TPA: hypothetical protein VLB69_14255, partial [Rudaea sp.]|nr:hypothetical protein [Rudaea sp.]